MEKTRYTARARSADYKITINGLLTKRAEVFNEAIRLRERLGEIEKDIGAIDRTLEMFGVVGNPDTVMPRHQRNRIFKRGELAKSIYTQMRQIGKPLTTRELTCLIILARDEDAKDGNYVTLIGKRVYKRLRVLKKDGSVRLISDSKNKQCWELGD